VVCGGSDIIKNIVESMKILTQYSALNSRDYNGLDMYKDSLSTYNQKALKAEWGDPGLNRRKVQKKTLPDSTGVATGN
jgi:hypothetical protein